MPPAITFRPLARSDFPQLAAWLAQPHVLRWWDHEFTPEAIERDFGDAADGLEAAEVHIALLDGAPFGLIQFVRFADYPEYIEEVAPVYPIAEGAASIDYFVGDVDRTGRGLGTAMIAAYVERIWAAHPDATHLVVPVTSANTASWRALEKAGFHLVAQVHLEPDNAIDDGAHHLLRLDRPSAR